MILKRYMYLWHVTCHKVYVTCHIKLYFSNPKIGHKSAKKFHFYGHSVKMATMCSHFPSVLLRLQILKYQKAKLVV